MAFGLGFDFSQPSTQADPAQDDLAKQWTEFLSDPRGRGALLSAGLTMMQPQGFGQSTLGQIGQGIGSAGESVRTQEALDAKQQEAERKAQESESRARLAESRAGEAGTRSELAGQRIEATRQGQELKRLQDERNYDLGVLKQYQTYAREVGKRNDAERSRALLEGGVARQEPVLSQQQWMRTHPELRSAHPEAYDRRLQEHAPEAPEANLLDRARDAIAKGAKRDEIVKRLREMGAQFDEKDL